VVHGELRQSSLALAINPVVELLGAKGDNGFEAGISQEIAVFGQQTEEGLARVVRLHPPGSSRESRLDVDSLIALALARWPDLAQREATISQAESQASTATREALPNLVARGVTEPRDDGTGGRVFRPGLGITLPLFNRNRGRIQALRATARQAEPDRESVAQAIRAQGGAPRAAAAGAAT
jgi:outer membrane protein TolC